MSKSMVAAALVMLAVGFFMVGLKLPRDALFFGSMSGELRIPEQLGFLEQFVDLVPWIAAAALVIFLLSLLRLFSEFSKEVPRWPVPIRI